MVYAGRASAVTLTFLVTVGGCSVGHRRPHYRTALEATHRDSLSAQRLNDEGLALVEEDDIEGAEEMVLRDLADQGKLQLVTQIACEYHHHRNPNVDSMSRTLGILEQAEFGYHLNAYRPLYPNKLRYQQDVIIHAYRKPDR